MIPNRDGSEPAKTFPTLSVAACVLLLVITAVLPFIKVEAASVPQLGHFLGRFHVVVLHFPIGLLAIALVLQVSQLTWLDRLLPTTPGPVITLVLAVGALSSFAAAFLGWLLSLSGGYAEQTLARHAYGGAATAIGALLALILRLIGNAGTLRIGWRLLEFIALGVTNLLLVITGHLGGEITHGADYLTEHAPALIRQVLGLPVKAAEKPGRNQPVDQLEVFDQVVLPILESRCVACHGAEKAKGKLRLDSFANVMKGGDRPTVVAGQPDESDLLKRIHLPLDDDDHMPPKGKPQPSEAEVSVLAWWIAAGAPASGKVRALNPPPEVIQAAVKLQSSATTSGK